MRKPRRRFDEVNYWESMSDSLVGLLMCVLLVMLLLVLFLVKIPDEEYTDEFEGDNVGSYQEYDAIDENYQDDAAGNRWHNWDDPEGSAADSYDGGTAGGDGGGDDGEDEEEEEFEDPDPGAGDGIGTDKAAVFVELVDGETGRTIKNSGIEFELYADQALKVLSVYYPTKVDYSKYHTDEKGTFYLPERIPVDTYSLHELTAVQGYDNADNTEFTIDKAYEWNDPFVVSVSISPSKNKISVQLTDSGDASGLGGASFDVIANEDIVTQDGTTRYKKNTIVDTILTDSTGYGESKELYLGQYKLRQVEIPEYYGKVINDTEVEVLGKNDDKVNAGAVTNIKETKTAVTVEVKDALYDTLLIEHARFKLTDDKGNLINQFTTDEKGRFTISDLEHSTTYHLEQVSAVGDYQMDQADYKIMVSAEGLVDDEIISNLTIKNRLVRIAVGVKDKLFRNQISNINVTILDSKGVAIQNWDTTGVEQTIEGIEPGEYQVIISGDDQNAYTITVEDKTDLQTFQFDRWTTMDVGALLGMIIIGAGLLVLMIVLARLRRHKKRQNEEE